MARLFDEFDEWRKRFNTPAGAGITPETGTTPKPANTGLVQTGDQWFTNLAKSLTTSRTPSTDRWTEPAKPPTVIAAAPTPMANTVQAGKIKPMTPPALSAIPSPLLNNGKELPGQSPLTVGDLPQGSMLPSMFGSEAPKPLPEWEGNTLTSINSNQEARPIVAPAVNEWGSDFRKIPESRRSTETNPNEAKFGELIDKLTRITGESPRVGRATELNAITDALKTIAPLTSYGQYGIAGINAETTKGGQNIAAETTRRGQDLNFQVANTTNALRADENSMNALYKAGMLKQGQEEIDIKKMLADNKNPQNYIKLVQTLSPKIKTVDPETGAEMETLDERVGIAKARQFGFEPPEAMKKGAQPQEGETKSQTIAGKTVTAVFKNGKWVKQ